MRLSFERLGRVDCGPGGCGLVAAWVGLALAAVTGVNGGEAMTGLRLAELNSVGPTGLAATGETSAMGVRREPLRLPDGTARFDLRQGGVRLLYRPNWASRDALATPGYAWGQGPGRWERLFEAGANGQGLLAVSVDPRGTNLVVTTTDAAGSVRTLFQARISWTYLRTPTVRDTPVPWREVAVNYTPRDCMVILDGVQQSDWLTGAPLGPGVAFTDSQVRAADLLVIGGGLTEGFEAQGTLTECVTFRAPLTPMHSRVQQARSVLSARVATTPVAVTLDWVEVSGTPQTIRRRAWPETNWVTLATGVTATRFTDTGAELGWGRTYEYGVGNRTMLVAVNAAPVERRGRVLVLVDETLERKLTAPLDQFGADLVGDGWEVTRRAVPRHDDRAWDRGPVNRRYIENVQRVKALIRSEHAASPEGLRAIVLVGHVIIPYSGIGAEDGHPDHNGAWPADSFYGDLDQEWSDTAVNTPAAVGGPRLRNVPGDGKSDPVAFNAGLALGATLNGLEAAVGRIDFASLPAFRPADEIELLRRYFDKNHRYRVGEMSFREPAIVGGFFYSPFNPESIPVYDNAAWTLSRLVGPDWPGVSFGDAFGPGVSALWAMQGGYGTPDTLHSSPPANQYLGLDPISTSTLARRKSGPAVGFLLLKGSYFGDWNLGDNALMRAVLAGREGGLAALWTRDVRWRTESLAVGEPLGDALVRTTRAGIASVRATYLLGDPTLRCGVVPVPREVAGRRSGAGVRLTWSAGNSGGWFNVYRGSGTNGPFVRVNDPPLNANEFVDGAAPRGRLVYALRRLELTTTSSGAYTNLSQAVLVPIE